LPFARTIESQMPLRPDARPRRRRPRRGSPDNCACIGVCRQDNRPGQALDTAVQRHHVVGKRGQWQGRGRRLDALGYRAVMMRAQLDPSTHPPWAITTLTSLAAILFVPDEGVHLKGAAQPQPQRRAAGGHRVDRNLARISAVSVGFSSGKKWPPFIACPFTLSAYFRRIPNVRPARVGPLDVDLSALPDDVQAIYSAAGRPFVVELDLKSCCRSLTQCREWTLTKAAQMSSELLRSEYTVRAEPRSNTLGSRLR
jgi:hypothetical protein